MKNKDFRKLLESFPDDMIIATLGTDEIGCNSVTGVQIEEVFLNANNKLSYRGEHLFPKPSENGNAKVLVIYPQENPNVL